MAGPYSEKLYHKRRAIQNGDEPDVHGWVTVGNKTNRIACSR
jgi:branched-chain amino acid aminotransferase